jgi:hypothetical protein
MQDRYGLTSLPYPLNEVHTASDVRCSGGTLDHVSTLLEQSLGVASALTIAARSEDMIAQDGAPGLWVLRGYIESTLAIIEDWQQAWEARRKAQREAAEAQRHAWVHRPLPQAADEALVELRTLLEQYDSPEMALLTALVRVVRICVPDSAIPQPDTAAVDLAFGDEEETAGIVREHMPPRDAPPDGPVET